MLSKVENPRDCCYILPNDIHEMHIAIKPIVNAFSNLVNNFLIISGTERLNTPLDKLNLIPRHLETLVLMKTSGGG
jgi:hypothetical protein